VAGACGTAASPSPSAPVPRRDCDRRGLGVRIGRGVAPASAARPRCPSTRRKRSSRAGAGRDHQFWTFYLSPTFDQYIKDTIARFEGTYPGVKVSWHDHQGTFKDDLNNSFAAGNAPDVINLSVSEGWVSEYAGKGLLLGLDTPVPQAVKDIYFPNLWKQQLIDGVNYQFPWYQGLNVELINKAIMEKAGVAVDAFPKTIDGLPALCKTILAKAAAQCAIRLTVTDLLAQMVYEGGVKVFSDDGKSFAFNSPEGVAWLQMYADMNNVDKTLDATVLTGDDRIGLNAFSAGAAPFYATGPNLARQVKDTNATLYGNLAMVPSPLGKSGVAGKGLMSISVKKDTKFPNASIALAQFFTNPRSMVQFAKQVAIYPSSPAAYDDPFFSTPPTAIEDAARSIAKETVATYQDIVPTVPNKADVNDIVRKAVESAIFGGVAVQEALDKAVADANKLLKYTGPGRPPGAQSSTGPSIRGGPLCTDVRSRPRQTRSSITPYTFLLPALVLLGIFVVYPIIAVVYYSFTDYDIATPPVWVGLDNFAKLLDDETFRLAVVHSFVYLLVTPILVVLSIGLAIVVNRRMRGIHIFRALYFVPAVSGSIAIGLAWRWLFDRNGFLNGILQSWGVIDQPVQWLTTPAFVLPIAMLLTIWAGVGYYSVIFLAGLQNISEDLYDAARIDGCSDFQKHRYISLPGLRPQIVFVAVISSLAALKVFDEIYVLTNRTGGILDSGVTMVFYLWKQAFVNSHAGYASAIAIALLAITLVFSMFNVRLLERREEGDA
jgi:ABC-type sugar transport system permease subunit/ABC-type glycerol-3-phosphate transport system substrate-binding protein